MQQFSSIRWGKARSAVSFEWLVIYGFGPAYEIVEENSTAKATTPLNPIQETKK